MPAAGCRHRAVGRVERQLELDAVVVHDDDLFGPTREWPGGPKRTADANSSRVGFLHRPRPLAHGAVNAVVAGVDLELVVDTVEGEPTVANAARPRCHHERPPMRAARVVVRCAKEVQAIDGQRHDASAVPGVDRHHRVCRIEREH